MTKTIVVDCRGQIVGKIAAVVAKQLLEGTRVVLTRVELAVLNGSLYRNKLKWNAYLNKRTNTNPRRGPYHHRAPSRIMFKAIRGMLPHKTHRGRVALDNLKIFEGVPNEYLHKKRVIIPTALKVTAMRQNRPTTSLATLSTAIGWRYGATVDAFEARRKQKSEKFLQARKAFSSIVQQAKKTTTQTAK